MTMMEAPPERSLDQRRQALIEANRVRLHRAQIKKQVVAGVLAPDHFLRVGRTDPLLATMKISDALAATPTFGPERIRRTLQWAGVSASKTFSGVTEQAFARLLMVIDDSNAPLRRRVWDWERERR